MAFPDDGWERVLRAGAALKDDAPIDEARIDALLAIGRQPIRPPNTRLTVFTLYPEHAPFRRVARALAGALAAAPSDRAAEIFLAGVQIERALEGRSLQSLQTASACLSTLCGALQKRQRLLAIADQERIADALLAAARTPGRFEPTVRAETAMMEDVLARPDLPEFIKGINPKWRPNPKALAALRKDVGAYWKRCEAVDLAVLADPTRFHKATYPPAPPRDPGLATMLQPTLPGMIVATALGIVTTERLCALDLRLCAITERTGNRPTEIAQLGSGVDIVDPITGKPYRFEPWKPGKPRWIVAAAAWGYGFFHRPQTSSPPE